MVDGILIWFLMCFDTIDHGSIDTIPYYTTILNHGRFYTYLDVFWCFSDGSGQKNHGTEARSSPVA